MPTINQVFPRRPLTVTLPKPGLRARLWAVFGILFLIGCAAALVLAALLLGLRGCFRGEARKAAVKAVSGQLMVPVPLTLIGMSATKNASAWTVQVGPEKPERWDFSGAAKPFVMGPETHILGVTSLSGRIVVPLDADLSWVDFTDAERAAIRVADHG